MYVGFTVVIDLDRDILTVNGDVHYDLFDIPDNWREPPQDEYLIMVARLKYTFIPPDMEDEVLALSNSADNKVENPVYTHRPTDIRAIMEDMVASYWDDYYYPLDHRILIGEG